MQSKAATVAAYLAELPEDRRRAIEAVRAVVLANLDKGFAEGMTYGMIGYFVPHSVYPAGYHCDPKQPLPFANLASQKNHMALYLMGLYVPDTQGAGSGPVARWFHEAWAKTGKRLDMGKACIRFKKAEDLALDVIGEAIRRTTVAEYIKRYESVLAARRAKPDAAAGKPAAKKRAAKASAAKAPAKKPAKKAAKKSVKKAAGKAAARR